MEKADTNLKEFITTRKTNDNMNSYLLVSIVTGIQFLHSLGVAHRDIKPENFLIFSEKQQYPQVKLCDFGISRDVSAKSVTLARGTPWYMAPEIQQASDQQQTLTASSELLFKADIWAIGKLIYFIWVHADLKTLKEQDHSRYEKIISNASVNELIKSCLYDDPNKRIGTDVLLQQLSSFFDVKIVH